jgi:hypothetical protein
MNNLAPAPRRGNMLNVYTVIGLNTVGLRAITKASKLGKGKTKATLQNLVFKGYVIKAGANYCLNTRLGFDTRYAEISKVKDSKKTENTRFFQQFADQENAKRRQAAMNFELSRGLESDYIKLLGQSNSGGVGINMQPNEYLEQQAKLISALSKDKPVKASWVTSDRLYIASLTVIVIAHLLRDGGVL